MTTSTCIAIFGDQFIIGTQQKVHSGLCVNLCVSLDNNRERRNNVVGWHKIPFVGNTDVSQKVSLLEGFVFFVEIEISDTGCREGHDRRQLNWLK